MEGQNLSDLMVEDDIELSMSSNEDLKKEIRNKWSTIFETADLTIGDRDTLESTIYLNELLNDIIPSINQLNEGNKDVQVEVVKSEEPENLIEPEEKKSHIDFAIGRGNGKVDETKSFLLGTANYEFFKKYFRLSVDRKNYPYLIDPFDDCYVLCGDCLCFVERDASENKLAIGKMFLDNNGDMRYHRRYYPDGSMRGSTMIVSENQYVISDVFSKASDAYKIGLMVETKNHQYWENAFVRGDYHKLYDSFKGLTFSPCENFNRLQYEDRYLKSDRKIYLSFAYGRLSYVTPYFNEEDKYLGIVIGQKCTTIAIKPGGSGIVLRVPELKRSLVQFKGGGSYKK